VVESDWAKVRIVTEHDDQEFVGWLSNYATAMGMRVILKHGSGEQTLVHPTPMLSDEHLSPEHRPPLKTAFVIRVETPALYPIELGRELQAEAQRMGRLLLRLLGYRVPKRVRPSPWADKERQLRVGKPPPPYGIAQMAADLYPEPEDTCGSDEEDGKRYSRVTSARKRAADRQKRHRED
jgi:hypothetical protein